MSKDQLLGDSLNQMIGKMHTTKRAHSKRASMNNLVIKAYESPRPQLPTEKYNLAPQYQYVKASYMNTTQTVSKLRQQAQEQREELRRQK